MTWDCGWTYECLQCETTMGEINWDGHPKLNPTLKLVFLNLPAHREKSGKSRNVEISQLIPTYLNFSLLFHLLILAPILKNPNNTDYPGTQKVGKIRKLGKVEINLFRFVSVEIPTVSTRPEFLLRPSRSDPDFSQSRDRPS